MLYLVWWGQWVKWQQTKPLPMRSNWDQSAHDSILVNDRRQVDSIYGFGRYITSSMLSIWVEMWPFSKSPLHPAHKEQTIIIIFPQEGPNKYKQKNIYIFVNVVNYSCIDSDYWWFTHGWHCGCGRGLQNMPPQSRPSCLCLISSSVLG